MLTLNTFPLKCASRTWDAHGLPHFTRYVGTLGFTAPGRIIGAERLRALHALEAVGLYDETRQSSASPYPGLMYVPAKNMNGSGGIRGMPGGIRGMSGGIRGVPGGKWGKRGGEARVA